MIDIPDTRAPAFAKLGLCCALLAIVAVLFMSRAAESQSGDQAHAQQHQQQAPAPLCSASSNSGPSNFYTELAKVNARMHDDMNLVPTGNVDDDFIRTMIPHHQGAVEMSRLVLKHSADERLRRLAQSIVIEQSQEIIYMRMLQVPSSAEAEATNVKVRE